MDMHFAPHVQAELEQFVTETGCSAETLINDLLSGYFDERGKVRQTLNSRYDDIKSGRVKLISGEEARARFREKSKAYRQA